MRGNDFESDDMAGNMDDDPEICGIRRKQMKKRVGFWVLLTLLFCIVIMTLFYHLGLLNSEASTKTNRNRTIQACQSSEASATATDWLNVRSGPGLGYGVICTVSGKTRLRLIGTPGSSNAWIQVKTPTGRIGWCNRKYVNMGGTENKKPKPDSGSCTATKGTVSLKAVAMEKMNIRSGPSTKYGIVCTIPANTALTMTGKANAGGTWVQVVTSDKNSGWCCRPYLKTHADGVSAAQDSVQAGNPLEIKVSLDDQKVTIRDAKGNIIKSFICSSGASGSETPTGTFTVSGRGISFYNSQLGEGAYYWTSFYGDYLFHSVPFDQNYEINQDEAAKLGTPASHGCIRLSIENAKWIYDRIPNGTKVIIVKR